MDIGDMDRWHGQLTFVRARCVEAGKARTCGAAQTVYMPFRESSEH